MSHGNFRISSLLAKGRMKRVLPIVSSSTIFVILTLPTFHRMRRSLKEDHGPIVGRKMLISRSPRNGSSPAPAR
jgi:hypothetical protein